MKTDTAEKIVQFVKKYEKVTAKQIYDYLQISPQAVFRQLKKLVENESLIKQGKPPKVFYCIDKKDDFSSEHVFSSELEGFINNNFYMVTPFGEEKAGVEGFVFWCKKRGLDVERSAKDYYSILKKSDTYRRDGLIDGLFKMKTTFKEVFLDMLFYQDFYAIERFGKTRLGQILLYAKQGQDKLKMRQLINEISGPIDFLIRKYNIDGIGFIPPTVRRQIQLMTEIEKGLNLILPRIAIVKVKTTIIVPQKTLNKLEDRIENAANTIIVDGKRVFTNVLLIDDAVGSGATLNETARHLKSKGIVKGKIVGFAITGSLKGFEVISEV